MPRIVKTAVSLVAAALMSTPALAQSDYPNRVAKIVNPYVAGSTPDILVRALAAGLSSRLGQQFIVENSAGRRRRARHRSAWRARCRRLHAAVRAGAGALGAAAGAQRYRLQARSLIPVCQTFVNTMGLAVRPESPIKTVADLVAAAKQSPAR